MLIMNVVAGIFTIIFAVIFMLRAGNYNKISLIGMFYGKSKILLVYAIRMCGELDCLEGSFLRTLVFQIVMILVLPLILKEV